MTIQGPVYRAIDAIHAKIDGLAERLTGEENYFNRGSGGCTARPEVLDHWQRWDAIESGDEPWPN